MVIAQCEHCGQQFPSRSERHVYCSDECREEHYRELHGRDVPSGLNFAERHEFLLAFELGDDESPRRQQLLEELELREAEA